MMILDQIKKELENYRTQSIEVVEGCTFSSAKLIRRIMLYKNCTYPTGKLDSQGNYKFWFDIISPRVSAEVKNIDFDTKDIMLESDAINDGGRLLIANAKLKQFLRQTGQAARLNEAVERNSEWGNLIFKKIKGGYKLMELNNTLVLNQVAETLDDSDVIERECMYSDGIRKQADVWENVDELIAEAKLNENDSSPEFWVYERNGEISEEVYWDAMGKHGGDPNKYLLCKFIVAGSKKDDPTQVMFYSTLSKKPYKEEHRGTYCGRWLRVGLYEALFDPQTRCNEIGNQIARGLEWSSKTIFRSSDRVIAQNILTDLQNGDIIKSADLSQVSTRMEGMDQLIADWNQQMKIADAIANSYEVVTGENSPSGTPFALARQQNNNANKLFNFLREKLGIVFQEVIADWVLPDMLRDLRTQDVLKLTDDSGFLTRYYEMVIDEWYLDNLVALGPHSPEETQIIKEQKMQQLMTKKETMVKLEKGMWEDFKARVIVNIVGENYDLESELETLKSFIELEQDPQRRTALIEMAMRKKNFDVSALPKTPPPPPQQPMGVPSPQQQPAMAQ